MKTKIILLTLLLSLSLVSATYIAGETYSFELEKPFSYYSIVGNSTEIVFDNVEQFGNVVNITLNKYMKNDSFEIVFFDIEKEIIHETVYINNGGGGGSSRGWRTKYKDRNVTEYVDKEIIKYVNQTTPAINVNEQTKSGYVWIGYCLLGLCFIIIILVMFLMYRSFTKEPSEEFEESIIEKPEDDCTYKYIEDKK